MCAQLLSHVRLFATPRTEACHAPLSMEFPRQEFWSGLPFPSPGDLPDPGIEPVSPVAPALAGGFLRLVTPGKTYGHIICINSPRFQLPSPYCEILMGSHYLVCRSRDQNAASTYQTEQDGGVYREK